jgi:imidazolonepropionase-like amidohydrolase
MHVLLKSVTAVLLIAGLLGCGESALPPAHEPHIVAIVGARLIDGTGADPIEDSVVVIEGTRIQAAGPRSHTPVPKGGEIFDAAGKTIIPGLVETHAHYFGDRPMVEHRFKAQLYYGVTTARSIGLDAGETLAIIADGRAGKILMPRMYTAGLGFTHPEGHPLARTVLRPAGPEEARESVARLAAQRVDFIKIWVEPLRGRVPKITPEIRAAIVEEAGKHQIPVSAHIAEEADFRQLAGLGVKDFLHTVRDQDAGAAFIRYCLDQGVTFTPTLANTQGGWNFAEHPELLEDAAIRAAFDADSLARWKDPAGREEVLTSPRLAGRKADFARSLRFVKAVSEAGIRLTTGSDSGTPNVPMGWGTHQEIELLVEAGLPAMQAIVAATRQGAELLSGLPLAGESGGADGGADYGVIAAGKAADLVVLDANPLTDIKNTRTIHRVMQAGQWLKREELLPRR